MKETTLAMKKVFISIIFVLGSLVVKGQTTSVLTWARSLGSTSDDAIQSIASDASGNVYVAGSFQGTVDFDPSAATTSLTSLGDLDAFFAKYSSSGALVWVMRLGSTGGADEIYQITTDASGNIYVAGYFSGTVDFDPGTGVSNLTSTGGTDLFYGKFNGSSGALVWVNKAGSAGNEFATSIAPDASGNVYVTGAFTGTVDFDPSSSTTSNKTSVGGSDIFLGKYTSAGALSWINAMGSTTDDIGRYVVTNGTDVWLGGSYTGTIDIDPGAASSGTTNLGAEDGLYAQYSGSTGSLIWWGTVRSTGTDYVTTLALDGTNLLTGGTFSGSASWFGANSTTQTKTSNGGTDFFIVKHSNTNFNLTWLVTAGGTGNEGVNIIASDASSNVYATGYFNGTVDFDPGAATVNLTSNGNSDVFAAKFSSAGALVLTGASGSAGVDQGTSVAVDGSGNIYLGGIFTNTIDADPGSGSTTLTSAGLEDGFFAKFTQVTLATEPTASPVWASPTSVATTSLTVNYTAAAGPPAGYIAVRKVGSAPTTDPVDGTFYTAGSALGDGTVAFVGNAVTFAQSGLNSSTSYFYKIYSYNGSSTTVNYRQTSPAAGSVATTSIGSTEPATQPTNLVFGTATSTSIPVSYTAAAPAVAGYIVLRKAGSPVAIEPVDGTAYALQTTISDNTVVAYTGTATSFTDNTGLTAGTTYYYAVFSYNGSSTTINYRQSSPLTGNKATAITLAAEPSANPTNLNFADVTSTSYTISFTAATGSPAGYIGIVSSSSSASFVPVDGTAYTDNQDLGGGSFVEFIGTPTSYSITGAASNTTYYYAVYAYNGSGATINYKQTSPVTNSVTTLIITDGVKPTLVADNTAKSIEKNKELKISVQVTDNVGVDYVYIDYGKVESVTNIFDYFDDKEYQDKVNVHYKELDFVSGNTYETTISASEIGDLGLVYVISAYDEADNEFYTQTAKVVTVSILSTGLSIPYSSQGTSQSNYRILSVPLTLEASTVDQVFGSNLTLGKYGDKSKWRMFRYDNSRTSELSGSSRIEPGKGYWFISSAPVNLASGAGKTAITSDNYANAFTLSVVKGWNQIGNPYPFNILWSDVKTANTALGLGDLKVFKGRTTLEADNILRVYEGGFVMAQNAGTMKFPLTKNPSAGREGEKEGGLKNAIDAGQWEVRLNIISGDVTYHDGGIGMNVNASLQNDLLDDFTLPRFLDYLELNHSKTFMGSAVSKDIVPVQENYIWDFRVDSNLPSGMVEINWDNSYFGANEKQLVLWDVVRQWPVDMRKTDRYAFDIHQGNEFRIFYGDQMFIRENCAINQPLLHSAYPNPSYGGVTFSFSVPEVSSAGGAVTLEIHDLVGRKISTVLNDTVSPGYHEVHWNGTGDNGSRPSAGVYLTTLKTGNKTVQQRIMIK